MNTELTIETVATGYRKILDWVMNEGQPCEPRGLKTRELICPTINLLYPTIDPLPLGINRKANSLIGAIEALQLCAGQSTPDLVLAASPAFEQYSENGDFHGAYGRRIENQLEEQVAKLKVDPDSRQAIITLWKPWTDNEPGHLDYPCTIGFQLFIRGGHLVGRSIMRSNDAWKGVAYDLFQFGQLLVTAANMLDINVGPLLHQPGSLHLYEPEFELVETVDYAPGVGHSPLILNGFQSRKHARTVLAGNRVLEEDRTESWYADRVLTLNQRKAGYALHVD